jgi:hypothetical protein
MQHSVAKFVSKGETESVISLLIDKLVNADRIEIRRGKAIDVKRHLQTWKGDYIHSIVGLDYVFDVDRNRDNMILLQKEISN